mgnify:CR=1 FL=1
MPWKLGWCEALGKPAVLTSLVVCAAAGLAGCASAMPAARCAGFGEPAHSWAFVLPASAYGEPPHDGAIIVVMMPATDGPALCEDVSVEEFVSPSGSRGKVFVHHPKGTTEMRLVVYDIIGAGSDMVFEWSVVQSAHAVQRVTARVLPGPPVRVFVDGREIEVLPD